MAFQIEKIHPLDLQPRKAIGVAIPFAAKDVFVSTYTTKDSLKSNLINFLLTEQGDRFLNPEFGAGLRVLLFEQITSDTRDQIEGKIRSGIYKWFPTVEITSLSVTSLPDTNTVTVYIQYAVTQTNIQDELLINFEQ